MVNPDIRGRVNRLFAGSDESMADAIEGFFVELESSEIPDRDEVIHFFSTDQVFDAVAEFFYRLILERKTDQSNCPAMRIARLKRKRSFINLEISLAVHEKIVLGKDDEIVPEWLCVVSTSKWLKTHRYSEMIDYVFDTMIAKDLDQLGVRLSSDKECPRSCIADFKRIGEDLFELFQRDDAFVELAHRMSRDMRLANDVHDNEALPPSIRVVAEMMMFVEENTQRDETNDRKNQ